MVNRVGEERSTRAQGQSQKPPAPLARECRSDLSSDRYVRAQLLTLEPINREAQSSSMASTARAHGRSDELRSLLYYSAHLHADGTQAIAKIDCYHLTTYVLRSCFSIYIGISVGKQQKRQPGGAPNTRRPTAVCGQV